MLFVLLVAICIVLAIVACLRGWGENVVGPSIVSGVVGLLVCIVMLIEGASAYPELRATQAKLVSLGSSISDIRGASYETKELENALVGGSLDNFQQSTKLSEYLQKYAIEKAEYNERLTAYKVARKLVVYKLFAYTCFIDSRVDDLEVIK